MVGGQKALVLPERVLMETAPMPLQYKLHDDAANQNKNNCPNKNKWWACRWPSLFLNAWSPQQGQRNCRRLALGMLEQNLPPVTLVPPHEYDTHGSEAILRTLAQSGTPYGRRAWFRSNPALNAGAIRHAIWQQTCYIVHACNMAAPIYSKTIEIIITEHCHAIILSLLGQGRARREVLNETFARWPISSHSKECRQSLPDVICLQAPC